VAGSPYAYRDDGTSNPIAIDPSQQFLYVSVTGGDATGIGMVAGAVLGYTIDPASGALTPFNTTPASLGNLSIPAIVPSGGSLLIVPLVP
jgi:6-phosphogluconolactonase (cycloisomerase 2 family)